MFQKYQQNSLSEMQCITPKDNLNRNKYLESFTPNQVQIQQENYAEHRSRNNSNRLDSHDYVENQLSSNFKERYRKTINNFEIVKKIGMGTFSRVCVGRHMPTHEMVAIKVIEKEKILQNQADKKRLDREIKILRKVRHPNISQLYQIIQTKKSLYIVMEYSERGELFQHIISQERLTQFEACKFLLQIIDAIEYLHCLGVTHRDLKPENLLLDFKYNIKLIDFGLSNIYAQNAKLSTACGSPCYACPEMLNNQPYDGLKADIWSVGVVLYAMCFGYLPFDEPQTNKLYQQIKQGKFEISEGCSKQLQNLLHCILQVDPNKRATIQQIRMHPFCRFGTQSLNQCLKIRQSIKNQKLKTHEQETIGIIPTLSQIPFEAQIFQQLKKQHIITNEECIVRQEILNNKHNQDTCSYYLFLNKKLRESNLTIANYYASRYNSINRYSIIERVRENYERRLKDRLTAQKQYTFHKRNQQNTTKQTIKYKTTFDDASSHVHARTVHYSADKNYTQEVPKSKLKAKRSKTSAKKTKKSPKISKNRILRKDQNARKLKFT